MSDIKISALPVLTAPSTSDVVPIVNSGTTKQIALSNLTKGTAWQLTGNAGTTAGTNFLGTTDNIALVFKTNNTESARFLATGELLVGATANIASSSILARKDQNATTGIMLCNATSGTSAASQIVVTCSASASSWLTLNTLSAGYSSSTIWQANTAVIATNMNGGLNIGTDGNTTPVVLYTNGNERMRIDTNGNVVINTAALATNATNGFLYIPTCAGAPTGTPTTFTGRVALVYDTTNNKLCIYNGAWKKVTLA